MNKVFSMWNLPDLNDLPAMERWHWRHCIPDRLRSAPWIARYVCYLALRPPPGAESYGYYNYRIHENWGPPISERDIITGYPALTPSPVPMNSVIVNLPGQPTEDFMGGERYIDDLTILRWVIAFKYPEGVPVEEGEDWYLNVHAKEVMQQPGLTRFFSYRALPNIEAPAPAEQQIPERPMPQDRASWHRVSEQWYENNDGWRKSIIDSPPKYTKPPWAKYDEYPFLEPYVDFASTFILERPTYDYLREVRPSFV